MDDILTFDAEIERELRAAKADLRSVIVALNRKWMPAACGVPNEIVPGHYVTLEQGTSTTNVPWKMIEEVR